MFKTCQHCGSTFKGTGNFCSDMCEIKSYTPIVVKLEMETIIPETKEELGQVKEELPETPVVASEITEIEKDPIQVRTNLKEYLKNKNLINL